MTDERTWTSSQISLIHSNSRQRGTRMVLTSMVNRLAEVGSGGLPHLSYDESSDLSGRVVLALSPDPSVSVGV